MSKFEKLIEHVVNEDMEKARELFHELCVEKSREIYENILDEEELDEAADEDLEESEEADEEDEDLEESFVDEDEFSDELPADDMIDDIEADEAGMTMEMDDEMGDEDLEDRVVDLEDALDDLEAKFSEIVDGGEYGDEEGEDELGMEFDGEGDDEEMDMDDEEGDDMDFGDEEDEVEETFVREYEEKVAPVTGEDPGKGKGPVAKNGKNPTGGQNSIDIGKGSRSENPNPSVGSYGDGMDTRDVGKKGPQAAPKPVSKDASKGKKGPVASGPKK